MKGIAARVQDDFKFCPTCRPELLNWMRGYSEARPVRKWNWLDEDVARCYICGQDYTDANPMNVEHVVAISAGGEDRFPNLGMACRSCNSIKGDGPLEMTPEQSARLERQQEAFARRYAEMKPHIDDGFRQTILGPFAGEEDIEPEYDCTTDYLALSVVEELWTVFCRYDNEDYPADYLPKNFVEICVNYTRLLLDDLGQRDWFEVPAGTDVEKLVETAFRQSWIDPETLERIDAETWAKQIEDEAQAFMDGLHSD